MNATNGAVLMAGIPTTNRSLYHRMRFLVGDPTAWIELSGPDSVQRILILRDIEMDRAKRHSRANLVHCPADFTPEGGLSGDRETATAQAAAECLRRAGVASVLADRSLPLIVADQCRRAGIDVICDSEMGVLERRAKDEEEVERLREAQAVTEQVMEMACRMVSNAQAGADGALRLQGEPLTSERIRSEVDVWLLHKGYTNPSAIVAGGPTGADCHDHGTGMLYTGQPVIIDIFPQNRETLYNGDCTRTAIHGEISEQLQRMHSAVAAAKEAAIAATRAGVTGEQVHDATSQTIRKHGFAMGLPGPNDGDDYCGMTHGTGHGIGLDVHEPPLLDRGGPALVVGDALTIEPGLYSRAVGGVRIEDMVIVREDSCENLNRLPGDLDWSD